MSSDRFRKTLTYASPERVTDPRGNPGTKLGDHLQIEYELDNSTKNAQRDGHEQRMKKFRHLEKCLAEDDWLFPTVEKCIGLK